MNGTDGDTGNNGITNSSADLNGDASVENGTIDNNAVGLSTDDPSSGAAVIMSPMSMRSSRPDYRVVPFLLPICMAPYSDAFMEALSNEGSWRRFWDTVRYHHRYRTADGADDGADDGDYADGRVNMTN